MGGFRCESSTRVWLWSMIWFQRRRLRCGVVIAFQMFQYRAIIRSGRKSHCPVSCPSHSPSPVHCCSFFGSLSSQTKYIHTQKCLSQRTAIPNRQCRGLLCDNRLICDLLIWKRIDEQDVHNKNLNNRYFNIALSRKISIIDRSWFANANRHYCSRKGRQQN